MIPLLLQAVLAQGGSPSMATEPGTVSWCLHPGAGLCSCSCQGVQPGEFLFSGSEPWI